MWLSDRYSSGRVFFAITLIVALGGCGFSPLYGSRIRGNTATEKALAQTYVAPVQSRLGRELRNALMARINTDGTPRQAAYRLDIALDSDKDGLAIRRDEIVTRFNLTVRARFKLFAQSNAEPVFTGNSKSIAAFNVVKSPFATLVAERDAEGRAARVLATEIHNQIAVFFRRRQGR